MHITNFNKLYTVYSIRCNTTNKIYIGCTSNIENRIGNHLSTFKKGISKCSSVKVLQENNYTISILLNGLSKEDGKKSESEFINAYNKICVNNNKPCLLNKKQYYQQYYMDNKKKKEPKDERLMDL